MSPIYCGRAGVIREITSLNSGINGVVKPISEMYTSISGVKKLIFSGSGQWEKYSVITTYSYKEETYRGSALDIDEVWAYPSTYLRYYSATKPYIKKKDWGTTKANLATDVWSDFETINLSINPSGIIDRTGYYLLYNSILILGRCFLFIEGEEIKKNTESSSNYYIMIPSKRDSIYLREIRSYEKDSYIETIEAPIGSYPDDGEQDGFWYVRIK